MKKYLFAGAALLLCAAMPACSDNDPKYEEVKPRQVAVQPTTLSGIVTDLAGKPIAGATVKVGDKTTTTAADGSYSITVEELGDQTVTISGPGMLTSSYDIYFEGSMDSSHHYTLSPMLAYEKKQTVNVSASDGGSGSVQSEAITGNDKAEVDIAVDVKPGVMSKDAVITITPIYTEESALVLARASKEEMLIGADVNCSDASVKLTEPIDISFALDQSVVNLVSARQLINGTWTDVPATYDNGKLVVSVTEFEPIGLFFPLTTTEQSSALELTFSPDSWDNLFGSSEMDALASDYTYHVGGTFDRTASNSLQALLVEEMARIIGGSDQTLKGSYPIDTEVLVGTGYNITGDQEVTDITVSSGSEKVTGRRYGTVYIRVLSFYRDHNGGVVSAD